MDLDQNYSLRPIAELKGHEGHAWHVAWNPKRHLLASCSADKSVRLYYYVHPSDGTTDEDIKFFPLTSIPTGHSKTVRAIAWSPSGQTLATASFDSNIGIWQEEGGGGDGGGGEGEWECMSLLEGHETECKSVAYSYDGNLLASCGRDKTVWIWEVHPDSDFECMSVLMEHTQDVKCVAWHPTQDILASASYDDTIKLYIDDPSDDWFCFDTLKGHTSTVWSISFCPYGSYLASASDDGTIRIWSPSSSQPHKWELIHVMPDCHERSIYSICWGRGLQSRDEKSQNLGWLASTGGDGVICIWDIQKSSPADQKSTAVTATLLARLPDAHGVYDVNAVSWCPREDGNGLLASAGDDGCARVWRVVRNDGKG